VGEAEVGSAEVCNGRVWVVVAARAGARRRWRGGAAERRADARGWWVEEVAESGRMGGRESVGSGGGAGVAGDSRREFNEALAVCASVLVRVCTRGTGRWRDNIHT